MILHWNVELEIFEMDLPGIDIVGGGLIGMETLALHSRI